MDNIFPSSTLPTHKKENATWVSGNKAVNEVDFYGNGALSSQINTTDNDARGWEHWKVGQPKRSKHFC